MKTAIYRDVNGQRKKIEYDDKAPCLICGEPVIEASVGGTSICPWCDMGICRYCGVTICVFKESVDGGKSKRELLEHIEWHKKHSIPQPARR
ncbi:MAG: hypothetical protein HWN68_06440 [Desulfobacterales bacterium]|nr:hypothetical protein [Desulfobacterales bacterium]